MIGMQVKRSHTRRRQHFYLLFWKTLDGGLDATRSKFEEVLKLCVPYVSVETLP